MPRRDLLGLLRMSYQACLRSGLSIRAIARSADVNPPISGRPSFARVEAVTFALALVGVNDLLMLGAAWLAQSAADEPASDTTTTTDASTTQETTDTLATPGNPDTLATSDSTGTD